MRIIYVIESLSARGGIERVIADKMNYLAEHTAHEIVLLTVWQVKRESAFPLNNKVRKASLDVYVPDLPYGYIALLPTALSRFNRFAKSEKPDIIIFLRAVGAFICAATSWKGKKIFESHTPYEFSNHNWLYPFMERKADAVVCLTKGDSRNFRHARRVDVIPNFTTLCTETRPDYSLKKIVFAGRDCPEKNIPRLKEIWRVVRQTHPDWSLDINTDTKDMVKAYLSGSILAMTSRAEGFGLVLVEAMSCGLPCIAFDCPEGPRDIIEDGKTGYLIPYEDDQMFIDKLSALMDSEALRRQMGEAAKAASCRYHSEPIMAQWQGLFESL